MPKLTAILRTTPLLIAAVIMLASGAWGNTILQNGVISAEFDTKALVRITDNITGQTINFTGVSSSITVDSTAINTATLTPSNTNVLTNSITYTYVVGTRQLQVVYTLNPNWRFVCAQMFLTIPAGVTSRINSVVSFTGNVTNAIYSVVQGQDPQSVNTGTTFVRFSNGSAENGYGMFALVQNPYVTWTRSGQTITMSYTPNMDWKSTYGAFPSDRCCIGPHALSGTRFPAKMTAEYVYLTSDPAKDGVDWSEVDSVRQCMKAFLTCNTNKCNRIHILWNEAVHIDNDAATPAGRVAYKRAIDRAKEFGCDDVLYISTNSAVSTNSPSENADGWQAEYCLWFSMGQQIRKGLWDPINGPIPISVQDILDYAATKNVKLSAYVYPSLPFRQNSEWINSSNVCDTGVRSFQDWLTTQLVGFANHTGAGGYCFDYWWINLSGSDITSKYAQFFGYRRILDSVRQQLPNAIFDLRQEVCWFGPWLWLDGTYPHPLNDDEGAGSWRAMSDLHVDRCYAARHRYKWFWHVVDQFAPIEIAPGFITHAGTRTILPDGTSELHPHDWDYMGWKYNLLSTVGTAPFNLVVNYIPVLDQNEYNTISQADKDWFNYWMDWAENHMDYMRNARPIISQIMIGKVDGSAAFIGNHGYIFLFNPNYRKISGDFKLDSSIGLNTGTKFIIQELEPRSGRLIGKAGTGLWNYGDTVSIPVSGTTAVVLEVLPVSSITSPMLLNMQGSAAMQGTQLNITNATGEVGAIEDFIAAVPTGTAVSSVTVNGRAVNFTRTGDTVVGKVTFAGVKFGIDQQVGTYDPKFNSTTYRGGFIIPQRIFTQLNNRRAIFPTSYYTTQDLTVPWTAPYRLLMFIHIADAYPTMTVTAKIDGATVTVNKSYNGTYGDALTGVGNYMFQGYYIDVSNLSADVSHQVEVTMPTMPAVGQFQGLFFDNVQTEYTQTLADAQLPTGAIVDLDASKLTLGSLTTWTNAGTLGGSFGNDTTSPQVQFLAGKRCVAFSGLVRMKSTFKSPSTITTNGSYTVSMWAYNPIVVGNECMLTWAHSGGATGTNAQFNYGNSTTSGAVSHGSTLDMGFDGGVPAASQWHHIAVTFDGSTEKVYVDGVLNAQESKTLSIFTTDYFYVGCAYTASAPTSYFSGSIASAQVFDRALGADEIAMLANPPAMTVTSIVNLPENSTVTLTAKPVTCAPRNTSNARTTTYFYVEEPGRTSGIRVQDGTAGQDAVTAGTRVTITGKVKTIPGTGERYIDLDAPAYNETGIGAGPFFITTKTAQTDANLIGQQVRMAGAVRQISGDGKWFTIADGYTFGGVEVTTKILIESNFNTGTLHSGDRVVVTGVVSLEGTSPASSTKVIVAQDVR